LGFGLEVLFTRFGGELDGVVFGRMGRIYLGSFELLPEELELVGEECGVLSGEAGTRQEGCSLAGRSVVMAIVSRDSTT
jgi:hypothetical protein